MVGRIASVLCDKKKKKKKKKKDMALSASLLYMCIHASP